MTFISFVNTAGLLTAVSVLFPGGAGAEATVGAFGEGEVGITTALIGKTNAVVMTGTCRYTTF